MDSKRLIFGFLAVIAILVSVVALWRGRTSAAEGVEAGIAAELGSVMAEETARVLNGQGTVVVVTRAMTPILEDQITGEVKAFRRGIKQAGGIQVVAVEALTAADFQGVPTMMKGKGLPPAGFRRLLEAHPGVDALVSFAGQPLVDDSLESITERPGVLCVEVPMVPLKPAFDWQLIDVAVVRAKATAEGGGAQPYYRAVTQETVGELLY